MWALMTKIGDSTSFLVCMSTLTFIYVYSNDSERFVNAVKFSKFMVQEKPCSGMEQAVLSFSVPKQIQTNHNQSPSYAKWVKWNNSCQNESQSGNSMPRIPNPHSPPHMEVKMRRGWCTALCGLKECSGGDWGAHKLNFGNHAFQNCWIQRIQKGHGLA